LTHFVIDFAVRQSLFYLKFGYNNKVSFTELTTEMYENVQCKWFVYKLTENREYKYLVMCLKKRGVEFLQ